MAGTDVTFPLFLHLVGKEIEEAWRFSHRSLHNDQDGCTSVFVVTSGGRAGKQRLSVDAG